MTASFLLCLLPALLATASAQAEALTCEKCSGSADSCKTPTGTCAVTKGVGGCSSVAGETALGGTQTTVLHKDCLSVYDSGIQSPLTFTVGSGKYLRLNVTRCNATEKCNSAGVEVPQENSTSNGLQCPACLALDSEACDGPIAPCTGHENYCIDFTGEIIKGTTLSKFAAKGCASASAQSVKPGTFLAAGNSRYLFVQAMARPAEKAPASPEATPTPRTTPAMASGGSLPLGEFSALYLPCLSGLLLVKLLP